LHDYPLALCDFRSLDPEKDLEPQDIVDRDEVLENVHVYHRPQHKWHYLSGQRDSELLVFRQADTHARKFGEFKHSLLLSLIEASANRLNQERLIVPSTTLLPRKTVYHGRVLRL
jgi:hypothetical protein